MARSAPDAADSVTIPRTTHWRHFPTPLVGREDELDHLYRRLADPAVRILTVTGPVGVGKSRLVTTALGRAADLFEAGTLVVELDKVCEESGDPRTAAEAAGGLTRAEIDEAIADVFPASPEGAGRAAPSGRFLLVLDGCEEILPELRATLPGALAACSWGAVMIAAPEPLGAYGEEVVRVPPLPVPDLEAAHDPEECEAVPSVRLFLRRAQAARPGFRLTPDNAEAVVRLCRRTDGLPLAIELAAARMKTKSPQGVLEGLDGDLDILSASGGETLSRHCGMRSAISWSLTRLDGGDQELLGRVSAFRSGVDLAAATSVADAGPGEVEERLARLVDKSLLHAEEADDGGVVFRLPHLTRQYVTEWLRQSGELTRVLEIHARYFLRMADLLQRPELEGSTLGCMPNAQFWREDVEAAMFFLFDSGDSAAAARVAAALGQFWHGSGALRRVTVLLRELLDSGRLPPGAASAAEGALGEQLTWLGEYREAGERLERALRGRGAGDAAGTGMDTRRLGDLAFHRGDLAEAASLQREAAELLERADAGHERAKALRGLAECLAALGEGRAAVSAAEAAHRVSEGLCDEAGKALAEASRAGALAVEGGVREAEGLYRSALARLRRLDGRVACAGVLERLAVQWVHTDGGREALRRAVIGIGAASVMRSSTRCVPAAPVSDGIDRALVRAREGLGGRRFDELWTKGRSLELGAAVDLVLSPVPDEAAEAPRAEGGHTLTAREYQVAELVAEGLTNRGIARRLGIAEWTAINHLRKVMRKLGVSSRVHVAGWFRERAREGRVPGPRDGRQR
ncbi:ATP-binding protein [Nocardiopsis chromatogenes]|uniref:ATP-binding protein n=1 Tax=Nocardiopsis chromatogenes TaxID=280239 RepID=UPI001267D3A2|nr:LuxR C-terminal-related transcriptional regulator [Nocardiopsis chromatogenes]